MTMKLLNRFAKQGAYEWPHQHKSPLQHLQWIKENAHRAVCIDACDANMFMEREREKGAPVPTHTPPPFPFFWIEFETNTPTIEIGIFSYNLLVPKESLSDSWLKYQLKSYSDEKGRKIVIRTNLDDMLWHTVLTFVLYRPGLDSRPQIGHLLGLYFTDRQGQPVTTGANTEDGLVMCFRQWPSEELSQVIPEEGQRAMFTGLVEMYLDLLWLMTVRNIEIVDAPPLREGHAKRLKKALGASRLRFKTIAISHTIRKALENRPGSGLSRNLPLHTVIGHFKHYDEKGLFGRYHGTFFFPGHLRGNKDAGQVKKTYVGTGL